MADFSHLSVRTAFAVVGYARMGRRPTDEMLLEAVEQFDPLLLSSSENHFIRAILSHKRGRRPRINISICELATQIEAIERNDAPSEFLNALADRIRVRRGVTEAQRSLSFHRKFERRKRNMLIRSLYRKFYKLQDGSDTIEHAILGPIQVPTDLRTRSERAITMVKDFLDGEFETTMLDERSMIDIAYGR